ncbi:MAG: type II toxin-antitoxin system VapC family toxin [Magnetococcales bacterium]|nr:type II toxin-antitoxin system VapC family toxin [Magnetococcales bacterium]
MLLDSNVVIYAFDPAYPQVADFFVGKTFRVSLITRLEVLGYHRLSQRDSDRFTQFFNTLDTIAVAADVIECAVGLRRSRSMGLADAIIAATCIVYDLSLVTSNVRDFSWIDGLNIIDPLRYTKT